MVLDLVKYIKNIKNFTKTWEMERGGPHPPVVPRVPAKISRRSSWYPQICSKTKNEFSRAQNPPGLTSDRPWFAVRHELSRPQNEPELTVFGQINRYVTETVRYFFLLWINGPSHTKKSNTNPHGPRCSSWLGWGCALVSAPTK